MTSYTAATPYAIAQYLAGGNRVASEPSLPGATSVCGLAYPAEAMLPHEDVERARRWAEQRVPERARHQVRVEIETSDQAITIVERRAPWRDDLGPEWTRHPIARLRYTSKRGEWTLYRPDRNLKFHHYDLAAPSADIAELLDEVERDPTSIFWG